jgi:hypothetical protein
MESDTNPDVDKLITFGQMALEQGWYDQAREYFEQALALDAFNREAIEGFAQVSEILNRRASFEPIKPEAPPAKPASKGHPIAEWVRERRREYAEWVDKRRWERKRRAAERLVAEERRRQWMLEREAEEYREWWETGVAAWEVGHGGDELYDAITHGGLLLDDGDYFDFF